MQGKLPGDAEGEDTIDVKAISKGQASSLRKHDTASWRGESSSFLAHFKVRVLIYEFRLLACRKRFVAKPQILFLAQLPNVVHSEQLFAQLCHAIAHRQWYFQFTRVQMAYICSQSLANVCTKHPDARSPPVWADQAVHPEPALKLFVCCASELWLCRVLKREPSSVP